MPKTKEKSPAFQFYPNDWLSSAKVLSMNCAQEGAYIHLLSIAWMTDDCGLPDDDEALASLSRLGPEWFNGSGTVIRKNFFSKDKRLYNKRLLKERKKQRARSKFCGVAGVASGKARNTKRLDHEQTFNERSTNAEQKPNSSFSSSSSPSKKKEKNMVICTAFDDRFWPAYPKKKAKPHALRAWKALKPDEETIEKILADLPRWKDTDQRFIPHPATYLNGRRWEDEDKERDRWAEWIRQGELEDANEQE